MLIIMPRNIQFNSIKISFNLIDKYQVIVTNVYGTAIVKKYISTQVKVLQAFEIITGLSDA